MTLPDDFIEVLLRSKEGQTLIVGVKAEILRLDSIGEMKINFEDRDAIAIETLGRKRAKEILQGILQPFMDFREKRDPTEDTEVY